jgi:hypothetical protein
MLPAAPPPTNRGFILSAVHDFVLGPAGYRPVARTSGLGGGGTDAPPGRMDRAHRAALAVMLVRGGP